MQVDGLFLVLIEPVDGLVKLPGQLALSEPFSGTRISVCSLSPPLVRVGLNISRISALPVDVAVVGNSVKPGREPAAAPETIERRPHFQKSLLSQVLCICLAAAETSQI